MLSGWIKVSKKTGKKWTRKPSLFDAKGTILKNAPPIWGGTVGKVAFSVTEGGYFVPGTGAAGISLSLEGVPIIELRSGAQGHPAYRRVAQQMHRAIAEVAGHRALAEAMTFVDHGATDLERLESERRAERRRTEKSATH